MPYRVTGHGPARLFDDVETAVLDAIGRTGADVRIVDGQLQHNEGRRWVEVGAARAVAMALLCGEIYEGVGMAEVQVH